jgi:hypothetical protein
LRLRADASPCTVSAALERVPREITSAVELYITTATASDDKTSTHHR